MLREEDLHPIGKFTRPHGIKGEISLVTDCELAEIYCNSEDMRFIVCNMDGIWAPFFIESYRGKNATVTLVKFENRDSEESIKILSGKTAYVPSTILPSDNKQPTGWNAVTGYSLLDERHGTIGQVTDIDDSTLNILLRVEYRDSMILVPAALVTSIQHNHKTMHVSLPEGFLEL